eukprot:m.367682 g.367682  ORF g.367682 m.367682 type:complete len:53 (-) comp28104_c2_seq1:247-405(-)
MLVIKAVVAALLKHLPTTIKSAASRSPDSEATEDDDDEEEDPYVDTTFKPLR